MPLAVKVNDSEVRLRLEQLGRAIRPASVFRIAGEVMRTSIAETFLDQGFPAGSWKRQRLSSLAVSFERGGKKQAFKKKQPRPGTQVKTAGFRRFLSGNKILTASGRLQKSITYKASGRKLEIGTNLKYAAIHQFGGVILPKGLSEPIGFGSGLGALFSRNPVFRPSSKVLRIPLPGGGVIFRKKVTIPARPYLLIKPHDPADIAEAIEDFARDKT